MARVARWILPVGISSLEPFELPPIAPVLIGRKSACHLRVPDTNSHVSGQHCRLVFSTTSGFLEVEDLSSRGTFVNGERVPSGSLKAIHVGDKLSLTNPSKGGQQVTFLVASQLPSQAGPAGPPTAHVGVPDELSGSAAEGSAGVADQARASAGTQVVGAAGVVAKGASPLLAGVARGASLPPSSTKGTADAATPKTNCTDPAWHASGRNHPLVTGRKRESTMEANAAKFASSRAARRLGIAVADPAATMQKMYDTFVTGKLRKLGAFPDEVPSKQEGKSAQKLSKDKKDKKDKKKAKKTKSKKDKSGKKQKRKKSSSSSDGSSDS